MSTPPPKECERLNDAQRAALDLDRDLLVAAGAGAGKTAVLGLRYLAILEEGRARVAEIVAFTFTEKAAAEMRARVQSYLLARIKELRAVGDTPRLPRLEQARREFHLNRISTVHGFCRRLLRENSWGAGLEPGAPMLDDRNQREARAAAVRSVLQRTPADDPEHHAALVRLGSAVNLGDLQRALSRMLARRSEMGAAIAKANEDWRDPEGELNRRRANFESRLRAAVEPAITLLRRIDFSAANSAKEDDKLRARIGGIQQLLAQEDSWRAIAAQFLTAAGKAARGQRGAAAKWKGLEEARDTILQGLDEAARIFEAAQPILEFQFDETHELRTAHALNDLGVLFDCACEAYTVERAGALDFIDLEQKAIALLEEDASAAARILFLLIDE